MNSSHPAKVFSTQDGFCHTQNTLKKKGSTAIYCTMQRTPILPPSSTHLTRVDFYWCQDEKFRVDTSVFDDHSRQFSSDRLTNFVLGLTKEEQMKTR